MGADLVGFVFVFNVIMGVNFVLCFLCFEFGDELVVTNYGYVVCENVF